MVISGSFFINTIEDGSIQQQAFAYVNTTPATTQSDDPPSPWSKVPLSVDATNKNCYVTIRTKTNNVWSAFSTPALYSHYAEDGRSIAIKGNFTKQDVIDAGYNPDTSAGIKSYLTDEHPNPSVNDGYLYKEDGYLWVWNANNEWQDVGQIQGPKGEDARYLMVDNTNVSMLYTSGWTLVSAAIPIAVRFARDGTIDDYPDVTVTPSTGVTVQGNYYGRFSITGCEVDSGTVSISYTYDGRTYEATVNVNRIVGRDIYDLDISPTSIPYNTTNDTPSTTTIKIYVWKMSIDGTRTKLTSLPSGFSLKYSADGGTESNASFLESGVWRVITDNSEYSKYRIILRSSSGSIVEDSQDVSIVKATNGARGDDGADAWNIEIDPSTITVPTYSRGSIRNFTSKDIYIKLYRGSTKQSLSSDDVSVSGLPNGFFWINNISTNDSITVLYGSMQAWKERNGTTIVYTHKGIGQVAVGDNVYNSAKLLVGQVSYVGTGVIRIGGGSTNYDINGSTLTPTLTQPTVVTVTATKSSVSRVGRFELVPSVQGEMGRNIYFAGYITEVRGTQFTVTDTSAPYVQTGVGTGNKPICYVFDGENGTYTFSSDPSHYSSSSAWASGERWVLMVNNFKYLMTTALFSNFAKLGSGIFNGDYAFSQYGTDVNGADSNSYQNFMPVNSTEYIVNSTSLVTIGEFTPIEGRTYKVRFNCSELDSGVEFVINTSVSTSGAFRYTCAGKSFDVDLTAVSRYKYYIMAHRTSGSTSRIVSAQVVDENVFNPNLWIDWFRGEIYAQLGHFVNVTVEGVMNNLIQEINSTNYSQFGKYISDQCPHFWGASNYKTLVLNPTKIGSVVRIGDVSSLNLSVICLPCAYNAISTYPNTTTNYIFDYGLGMSIDELRQCIGKELYILPSSNATGLRIAVGGFEDVGEPSPAYQSMLFYSVPNNPSSLDDYTAITNTPQKTRRTEPYTLNTQYFVKLTCKLGWFNTQECIYWEQEQYTPAMTNVTNYTDY